MNFEKEFATRLAEWDAAKAAQTAAWRAWLDDGYRDAAGVWIANADDAKTRVLEEARKRVDDTPHRTYA